MLNPESGVFTRYLPAPDDPHSLKNKFDIANFQFSHLRPTLADNRPV